MNDHLSEQAAEPPTRHSSNYFGPATEEAAKKFPHMYDRCACGNWKWKRGPRCRTCFRSAQKQKLIDEGRTHPKYVGYSRCECGNWKGKTCNLCRKCLIKKAKPPTRDEIFYIGKDRCRYIPTTKKQYTIVDADDYKLLSSITWSASKIKGAYRVTTWIEGRDGKRTTIFMHNFFLPPLPDGYEYDHINRNPLDNRRSNLRPATKEQNVANQRISCRNTSGYKGVCKKGKRWEVNVSTTYVGRFDSPEEAARIYDREAYAKWGEFAWLNFPDEWPKR